MKRALLIACALACFMCTRSQLSARLIIESMRDAGGGTTLLLDESGLGSAAGAYSVARRLRAAYSGNIMQVRRASDNTNQDIGFSGDIIDEASLESFCSGTDCFIEILYDQSGGSFPNLDQTDNDAHQPEIVSGGVMHKDGDNNAYCLFTSDHLDMTPTHSVPWSIAAVFEINSGALNNARVYGVSASQSSTRFRTSLGEQCTDNDSGTLNIDTLSVTTQYLTRHSTDASDLTHRVNDAAENSQARAGSTTRNTFVVGAGTTSGGNPCDLNFYEIVIWQSDVAASDSTLQNNCNTHYTIW